MKKIPIIIIYVLTFAVTLVNSFYMVKGAIFSDIKDLPSGEYYMTAENPENTAKINMYRIKNNLGSAIRCELKTVKKTRNVFWQTGIEDAEIYWENNNVVNINGVSIDVIAGGFYDCRRGVSLFQDGAIEGGENTENE